MRADGIIVIILLGVKFVGEIGHTHAQFKGQPTRFTWCDGEIDERVKGEHLSQLGRDAVVAET